MTDIPEHEKCPGGRGEGGRNAQGHRNCLDNQRQIIKVLIIDSVLITHISALYTHLYLKRIDASQHNSWISTISKAD